MKGLEGILCFGFVILLFGFTSELFTGLFVIILVGIIAFIAWSALDSSRIEAEKVKRLQRREKIQEKELADKNELKQKELAATNELIQFVQNSQLIVRKNTSLHINYQPLLKCLNQQYGAALRSDHSRIKRADKYGRVTDNQKVNWANKLYEIISTANLNNEGNKLLDNYAESISVVHLIPKGIEYNANKRFKTFNQLKKHLEFNSSVETLNTIKANLTLAYESDIANQKSTTQVKDIGDGFQYEFFCQEILNQASWNTESTPASNDHGADILAYTGEHSVAIQCKYYTKPVGNTGVQEIIGALKYYGTQVGVVVAPNGFTTGAYKLAEANSVHLLHHDDLKDLSNLL